MRHGCLVTRGRCEEMPGEQPVAPGRVLLVKKFVMRDGAAVGTQAAILHHANLSASRRACALMSRKAGQKWHHRLAQRGVGAKARPDRAAAVQTGCGCAWWGSNVSSACLARARACARARGWRWWWWWSEWIHYLLHNSGSSLHSPRQRPF